LFLAAVPGARWAPAAVLIGLSAAAPWVALKYDGVSGLYEIETSYRWKPSVTQAAEAQLANQAEVAGPTGPAPDEVPPVPGDQPSRKTDGGPNGAAGGAPKSGAPAEPRTGDAPATPVRAGNMPETTAVVPEFKRIGPADCPGFRGAQRTGEVPAAAFRGWTGAQPTERWRNNPVGPAWSSVCAVGEFLYTQEQRGESESVVCYRADTGKLVWSYAEPGKHSDLASGAGPRATPTFADGRVYAITASGTVCALRAWNKELLWRVNLADRFEATKPMFGLSTSPLVLGDLVLVNPASAASPRLVALSAATGETRWATEAKGTDGYSSPHAATIGGVAQVLIFNGSGLFGHDPATGRELWHYDWVVSQNEPTTVQPLVLADGRVIVGGGNVGTGSRCVKVVRDGAAWTITEVWKSKFTPKFNDVVRVGDSLFGLDSGRLVCVDLATGAVRWKEGQYGSGQLLLLGDKILIATESGQLACAAAKADDYEELWKLDVMKGKTWNHPVVARGRLYYRNTTELVAFDLPGYTDKP
jgi:outer membrane protein assembly factor BamB